ncbi:Cytochrome P450 [Penicillium expansum]|nr:Cytochrome P450 [Penicillium expansum]
MLYSAVDIVRVRVLVMSPTIALLGIVVILVIYQFTHTRRMKNLERLLGCEKPRGESDRFPYDILGIAKALELGYHFRCRSSLSYTNNLFSRYGETYASRVMGHQLIFTCNPENTTHLLSTAFADFDSSPLRKPLFEPITPHGIFTLDGVGWKASRDQLRGRLADLRKIIDLDQCEKHFQAYVKHIPTNGTVFDVQACNFALSLDIQTLFSLGESVDALSFTQSQEKKQFFDDLLYVKNRIVQDGFRGPLRHLFPRGQFLRACKRARNFVLTHATREVQKRRGVGEKIDSNMERQEISQFADQALSVLLANDSMSTALSGMFYCLSKNEHVVRKLRGSIVDTIGFARPTLGQLNSLHYVRWVIFEGEALRLYPAVVLNARVANKHSTLPSGGGIDGASPILLRKGEIVVFSTWAQHRLGEEFGVAPEEFHPERWEHLSGDMPGFIPFNKGT